MAHTVLITGANGFIGSPYNSTNGITWSQGRCRRRHTTVDGSLLARDQTPSHIIDVTDAAAFRELSAKEKPTHCIFHAARRLRNEDPSVLNICYHAMTNILEAAKAAKMRRVVYSSSASIYGQLKKNPATSLVKEEENAVTIYPATSTAAAKTVSEWMGDFIRRNTA